MVSTFLLCNFILAGLTGFILAVRRLLRGRVSPQIQYRLWFLWLASLFVPFLPVDLSGLSLPELICDGVSQVGEGTAALTEKASGAFSISGDLAVSVSSGSFGSLNKILLLAWTAGAASSCGFLVFSWIRFRRIRRSALPIEKTPVRRIFDSCKREMNLHRNVGLYSTGELKSPAAAGILSPAVYLPLLFARRFPAGFPEVYLPS